MFHQEHVCIQICNPLLALLRDTKVAQGINNIRLHHLPEKLRVVYPQVSCTVKFRLMLIPVSRNSLSSIDRGAGAGTARQTLWLALS